MQDGPQIQHQHLQTKQEGIQSFSNSYGDIIFEDQSESDDLTFEISVSPMEDNDEGQASAQRLPSIEDELYLEEEFYEEEFLEEVIPDDLDDRDGGGGMEDQSSTSWLDDGRDYTKDPHIAPKLVRWTKDHFDLDTGNNGESPSDFYLALPDLEDVSSLEDDLSEAAFYEEYEEEIDQMVTSQIEGSSSPSAAVPSIPHLHASVDWGLEDFDLLQDSQHPPPQSPKRPTQSQQNHKSKQVQPAQENPTLQSDAVEMHDFSPTTRLTYFQHQFLMNPILPEHSIFSGRHDELKTIQKAFARLYDPQRQGKRSRKRCLWIHGKAGIGKTALAETFVRQLLVDAAATPANVENNDSTEEHTTKKDFLVGRGSFGERSLAYKPFSGLVECLDELVLQLIQASNDHTSWRDRLLEGLGAESAQLLAPLIPNLAQLLELDGEARDHRQGDMFDLATTRLFHRTRFALRGFAGLSASI